MHQIDIINLALTRLGMSSITSLTEGSTEAAGAAKVWGAALDSTLQECRWGFNTRRTALALKQEQPVGAAYNYAYGVPTDLLQPYEIFQSDVTQDQPIPFIYESGLIYTDQAAAVLIYGAATDSVSDFSAQFCNTLAWRMAADLAGALTQKMSLMEYAVNRYEDACQSALKFDPSCAFKIDPPWRLLFGAQSELFFGGGKRGVA